MNKPGLTNLLLNEEEFSILNSIILCLLSIDVKRKSIT
ncbi:unnamed protein product [Paramecium octaurelia]|uniref:Uncharacterized protein n=1 Tax=Paramecium octaurelia TaxID=43137 RepID=A0A8S1X0U9_PAROT|nr:unnamed protein product [Paramecium octaurelia]